MEQEVIDFIDTHLISFQTLPNDLPEASDSLREHRPAFHMRADAIIVDLLLHQRRERAGAEHLGVEFAEQGPIRMQMVREDATGLVVCGRDHNGSASAVSKEDGHVTSTVVIQEYRGKYFCA